MLGFCSAPQFFYNFFVCMCQIYTEELLYFQDLIPQKYIIEKLILFIIFPLKNFKWNFNFHMKLEKIESTKFPTGDLKALTSIPHYLPVQTHHNSLRASLVVVVKLNCKCWLGKVHQKLFGSLKLTVDINIVLNCLNKWFYIMYEHIQLKYMYLWFSFVIICSFLIL